MAHIQQLNRAYQSILNDFTKPELWNQLDLILLDLKYKGYSFQIERKRLKGPCRIRSINFQVLREFVQIEIKKSLQLQLYSYLQSLITYKKKLSPWNFKRRIKINKQNHFIEKDNQTVIYVLCKFEIVNIKTLAMIERRFKKVCINDKKS
jgi:hypothetical protein